MLDTTLFLGIAKHAFKVWRDVGIIGTNELVKIQERLDLMNPPPKVGRIPRKISAGFASFTADEWKYWILIYSLHSLYGIIHDSHFRCWCIFVDACHLLVLPVISESQIFKAHELLITYFKEFVQLYGPKHCSPNMHMACHIKECMLDYGPLFVFWCFDLNVTMAL